MAPREPRFNRDKLIMLRRERGWSLRMLARLAGSDHSYLSQIERGLRVPSDDKILTLAVALGVTWADLVGGLPQDRPGDQPESAPECAACGREEAAS